VSGKNIEEGIFLYNFQPAIGRCVGITSAEDPDRLLVFLDDDPQGEVRGGFHMTSFKLPPAAGAGLSRKGFDGTASRNARGSSHAALRGDHLKLPRFRGVFDGFVDYDSVVTTSIIASNTIGER
jgi:hypothetical protein